MSFNAFELVPVIDRVQLMGDKPRTTVGFNIQLLKINYSLF